MSVQEFVKIENNFLSITLKSNSKFHWNLKSINALMKHFMECYLLNTHYQVLWHIIKKLHCHSVLRPSDRKCLVNSHFHRNLNDSVALTNNLTKTVVWNPQFCMSLAFILRVENPIYTHQCFFYMKNMFCDEGFCQKIKCCIYIK